MDDVTDDLRRIGIRRWTKKGINRELWRLIVREVKNHPGLYSQAAAAAFIWRLEF